MARELALTVLNQLGASADGHPAGAGLHGPMAGMPGAGFGSLGTPGLAGGGGLAGVHPAGAMSAGPGVGATAGAMGAAGPAGGLTGGDLLRMGVGGGDLLSGSSFAMNRESHGGILSVWSRGAQSRFAGREGALSLGGDVRTTMVRGRLRAGAAGGGPVARAQPRPGRVRRGRGRPRGLVGDGPLPVAGLSGDRPPHGVGRDGLRRGRGCS